jgi:hypothetical protein
MSNKNQLFFRGSFFLITPNSGAKFFFEEWNINMLKKLLKEQRFPK